MNSMNVTLSTNTASRGTTAKFRVLRTLGESNFVDEMSSFEERSRISVTATRAPPTPRPMAVDIVIADEAAVVDAAEDTILDSIIVYKTYIIYDTYHAI